MAKITSMIPQRKRLAMGNKAPMMPMQMKKGGAAKKDCPMPMKKGGKPKHGKK